jgi:hypothetical protein
MYNLIASAVEAKYPGTKSEGTPTPTRTGALEVEVTRADGKKKLVHSKNNGDGPVDKSSVDKVVEKITAFLKE